MSLCRLLPYCLALLLCVSPSAWAELDFASKGKAIALEIATNPLGFFYDLHQMAESPVPTRVGRRWTISSNIFSSLLPFSFAGVNGRYNLLSEHPGVPQVELFGGYSKMLALEFVDSDQTEGSVDGHHYGISMMQSIHPKARMQLAYEVSTMDVEVKFKKNPLKLYGTTLNSVKGSVEESFIMVGAELLRGERKYLFTQMGFGLDSTRILARVVFVGHVWDWGLTVYPEGPLVIYPTLGFRFGR